MTQRLFTALIRHPLGAPPHLGGHEYIGEAAPAMRLEIAEDVGTYFLLRFAANGEMVGDTPHDTLDDAQRQASLEYEHDEWSAIEAAP